MNNEFEKDLEGSDHGLIGVMSRHLPGGVERNFTQASLCLGRDSKRGPLEYESSELPLS
jgi:hypothetical protein